MGRAKTNALYKIVVTKWNEHNKANKKYDPKSFKKTMISNNFCHDSKLSALPLTHRWLFLGILLECGNGGGDTVMFSERQLRALLESSKSVPIALDALQSLQVLTYEEVPVSGSLLKKERKKEQEVAVEPNSVATPKPDLPVVVAPSNSSKSFEAQFDPKVQEVAGLLKTLFRGTIPGNIKKAIPKIIEACDNDLKAVHEALTDLYQSDKIATGVGLTGSHSAYVSKAIIERFALEVR